MRDVTVSARSSLASTIAISTLGATVGGTIAALLVVGFIEVLKATLAVVSRQNNWVLILAPLIGLALSVLVLYGIGLSEAQSSQRTRWAARWRTFPGDAARSHLTDDMVASAGVEERFPWRLAPIRLLAIFVTVGLGGPMGTEAPAAYLGVATGSALGAGWRSLLRPAAVGGGAAGVAVLMGIPLVGTAYILELERRHKAPLNAERVTAALVGGFVGWLFNISLGVNLIRLVVPREPPHSIYQALITAIVIGVLSGSITALSGAAIYRAKAWRASPIVRLELGGLVLGAAAIMISVIASPSAAIGPGGGRSHGLRALLPLQPLLCLPSTCFAQSLPQRPRRQEDAVGCSCRFWQSAIWRDERLHPRCKYQAILRARRVQQAASAVAITCRSPRLPWFSARAALNWHY